MNLKVFDKLRALQRVIREEGLAGTVLALPAPKLLLLPDPSAFDSKEEVLFGQIVNETEIVSVSRDLFNSGFFNQAVVESFKALDLYVKQKSGHSKLSGTTLANTVFSPSKPVLGWSKRVSISEDDEQKGYHMLFSGGFLGIRNPCSHEINWIADHAAALDAILLAQHLLRKAKSAVLVAQPTAKA